MKREMLGLGVFLLCVAFLCYPPFYGNSRNSTRSQQPVSIPKDSAIEWHKTHLEKGINATSKNIETAKGKTKMANKNIQFIKENYYLKCCH